MVASTSPFHPRVVAVVAAGGAVGAVARQLATTWLPGAALSSVLAVNVLGCVLMGVLAASAVGRHLVWRPFLGTGVLGGFTTVSTYALLVHRTAAHDPALAVGYAVLTPVLAVAAAGVGSLLAGRGRS